MPNYVRNEICIYGKRSVLEDILKLIDTENDTFFENILPVPKELMIHNGSNSYSKMRSDFLDTVNQIERLKDDYEVNRSLEPVDNFVQSIKNYITLGYPTWYEWCCEKWGTKWDASDIRIIEDMEDCICIGFDTAWDAPFPIFEELLKKYPEIEIEGSFADEDILGTCGVIETVEGNIFTEFYDIDSEERRSIGFELWGFTKDDYEEVVNE